MKRPFFLFVLFLFHLQLSAQPYPFQDTRLTEEERLDNLISLMTKEEKVSCLSTRLSVPRLGIRGTRTVEGLHGLALSGPANWAVKGKGASPTTTFPQAIGLAQMWDPEMMTQIASLEAEEARFLAQNPRYGSAGLIVFAPNADLGRDIRWGRTEECFGEDAFLAASLTTAFVKGLQGDHPKYWKTASLMKHFLANSNENNRTVNSSDFDEQLFREYYGYAFYKGITKGGSRAYMAAYNKYNGIPCTVHPVLTNTTVNEWGQNGIIATDGGAFRLLLTAHQYYPDLTVAAAACINAGITMFLDNYREPLNKALETGLISEKDIDRAVRGNLRVMLRLGLLDQSPENPYSAIGIVDTIAPWTKPETHQLVREATARSLVLLKNENRLLPLDKEKIKSIAVVGPRADVVISDWYAGTPPYAVTPLQGIRRVAGEGVKVLFAMSNKADSAVILASQADVAIVCQVFLFQGDCLAVDIFAAVAGHLVLTPSSSWYPASPMPSPGQRKIFLPSSTSPSQARNSEMAWPMSFSVLSVRQADWFRPGLNPSNTSPRFSITTSGTTVRICTQGTNPCSPLDTAFPIPTLNIRNSGPIKKQHVKGIPSASLFCSETAADSTVTKLPSSMSPSRGRRSKDLPSH